MEVLLESQFMLLLHIVTILACFCDRNAFFFAVICSFLSAVQLLTCLCAVPPLLALATFHCSSPALCAHPGDNFWTELPSP